MIWFLSKHKTKLLLNEKSSRWRERLAGEHDIIDINLLCGYEQDARTSDAC